MKIWCVVNRDWKEGNEFSKEQYFATQNGMEGYFRDVIKCGHVEEVFVTSPITEEVLVKILNGERFTEKRSQIGYKYKRSNK